MTAWRDVEQAEPEFARRVRELFDARRHKTIATVRATAVMSRAVEEVGLFERLRPLPGTGRGHPRGPADSRALPAQPDPAVHACSRRPPRLRRQPTVRSALGLTDPKQLIGQLQLELIMVLRANQEDPGQGHNFECAARDLNPEPAD